MSEVVGEWVSGLVLALLALGLDALLGEPRRFHPLVGFGQLAQGLERRLNGGAGRHGRGLLAWALLVLPLTALVAGANALLPAAWGNLLALLLLYLALGGRSLAEHAAAVRDALATGDLAAARHSVARLVSRESGTLDAEGVRRATVESVLENGNDALFGALFWFLLAGAPGVVLYRLANTLDAMWGYRTPRYAQFGWAAARLDDLLNWIPARLTALAYAGAGSAGKALHCWRTQAAAWESPNAGPVMAAGAGSLGIELGGPAWYHGHYRQRPRLGLGGPPAADAIDRTLALVRRALLLWLALATVLMAGVDLV